MSKRRLLSRQVEEIFKQYYQEGRDEYWLSRRYSVAPETIRDIINRRTWKNIDLKTPAEIKEENELLTQAYQALLDDGYSVFAIAMRYNTTPHKVMEILSE